MLDYLIVGAGPAGLACALEAEGKGRSYIVMDKGAVVNSIYNFPVNMTFFSTPDRLQLGDSMFITDSFRPTREQVLNYYLSIVRNHGVRIATYRKVVSIEKSDSSFQVTVNGPDGKSEIHKAVKVIIATGYYDNPNMLSIEGENLDKVSHYYSEPHPCYGREVAVIGGKNSSVEAAINFYRGGAKVTLIHRGPSISDSVKYWVRPDIEKLIEDGKVEARFNTVVTKVTQDSITLQSNGRKQTVKNDLLFALTGYHPDLDLLEKCGVTFDSETLTPSHNEETLETNVKGLYLAGSIAAGMNCNKIFIENSRLHGKMIVS